ncbi:hypothetical protein NLB65_01275 [Candidatus Aminicenantes bacterium AC-335-B20]|jgi:hypothetical protein|nr:hypothetical protein [SCandidatus Aminicenantes bacterium Aminicenantia_JdfR_composite]MCP2596312.1 hypothetical protein [Candidatus Aminicenantes bacterium AC-335-G13]MCP2599075.1 hypothetical protein [Candidatus Aminicenantes bacterium AC-335-B20]MCP2606407.1 hypothetical protein [Candidatus Aminicenantes bacterium AC-708-I09]MCP2617787.1 hypothetical protein [Candidatus Aminicenantes bacterium AC-335-A11]
MVKKLLIIIISFILILNLFLTKQKPVLAITEEECEDLYEACVLMCVAYIPFGLFHECTTGCRISYEKCIEIAQ